MGKEIEWVPWYRRKGYKGKLTEDEKRHLDSFRQMETHPAADYDDLPEEVQGYINELELAVHDAKQDAGVGGAIFQTVVGAFIVFIGYKDIGYWGPITNYALGILLIIYAWAYCTRQHKKNADALFLEYTGKGAPASPTDEEIQEHWELSEVQRYRKRNEADPFDDLNLG